MNIIINIVGIFLILFGVASLTYQGVTYTQRENLAQFGNLKVTADTEKTIVISPIVGGVSIVAGIALVLIGRLKGK